ncbi:MAG TPA: hypothetical protein VEA17_09940 [Bordetella sp.]|nr:hypothetical protein [Bordetella sp.]
MRTAFGKMKTRLAAGIGSTVALGAATLYSIFGAGPPAPVVQYAAGSQIDAGQWQVVPRRAWVSRQKVYDVPLKPGQQALVLEVDLGNRTRMSTRDYSRLFSLHPIPGVTLEQPLVAQVRDPQLGPLLHPGLGERVAFVWRVPDTATPPQALKVDVVAKTFKPIDNLYGTPGWYNPAIVGQVMLPLEALAIPPGAAAEPGS